MRQKNGVKLSDHPDREMTFSTHAHFVHVLRQTPENRRFPFCVWSVVYLGNDPQRDAWFENAFTSELAARMMFPDLVVWKKCRVGGPNI